MIMMYGDDNCAPCADATKWMDQHNIKYTAKGMVAHIDEYPTIVVNGTTIIGWGEEAKQAILGGENDD